MESENAQTVRRDEITIEDVDEVITKECTKDYLHFNDNTISLSDSPDMDKPHLKILVQPASKALRFRYECEGRSAGSLPGANSTQDNRTFPTIQIVNSNGPAVVVVSCITKDYPYRPHPHKLVGRDGCRNGICTVKVDSDNMVYSFSNIGIQCVKKKDIDESLKERENLRVDPFPNKDGRHTQPSTIDLNTVRLCFQAFVQGKDKDLCNCPLDPVMSDVIYDKKALCDLTICKLSVFSGTVKGGTEVIMLCDKVSKDDIEIVFYEEREDRVVWQALADFQPNNVHKQFAITFLTPPYADLNIEKPVEVLLQLRRRSDGSVSEPRTFQYMPIDIDPEAIHIKRRKVASKSMQKYLDWNLRSEPGPSSAADTPFSPQPREFKAAHRRYKQETRSHCVNPVQPPTYEQSQQQHTYGMMASSVPIQQSLQIPSTSLIPSPIPFAQVSNVGILPPMHEGLTPVAPVNATMWSAGMHRASPSPSPDLHMMQAAAFNPEPKKSGEDEGAILELMFNSTEFNNMLPLTDTNMNALVENMSSTSFHLDSLEEAINDHINPDGFNQVNSEIMQLNELGGRQHPQPPD